MLMTKARILQQRVGYIKFSSYYYLHNNRHQMDYTQNVFIFWKRKNRYTSLN